MTDIIDFNKWKVDKENKDKAKFIWHSFPYEVGENFRMGDILVKINFINEETQRFEYAYVTPEKEEIEDFFNLLPINNDGKMSALWMNKETLDKILSQYCMDKLIG